MKGQQKRSKIQTKPKRSRQTKQKDQKIQKIPFSEIIKLSIKGYAKNLSIALPFLIILVVLIAIIALFGILALISGVGGLFVDPTIVSQLDLTKVYILFIFGGILFLALLFSTSFCIAFLIPIIMFL